MKISRLKIAIFPLLATCYFSAHAEKINLQLVGQQGDHYFFTVPKPQIRDQAFLLRTAEGYCFNKAFCYVHFWETGTASPRKFPLAPKEVSSEVASYTSNQRTGKKQMLWRCSIFPKATKDECFS
ncbi:hypothetical protein [Comamonas sp. wu1-DMT]|uniref:hypothetical protein n=1 Tax=Comamonas sp. wu1-DMT TaxID=3126390 RepID=UPI0032E517CF